MLYSLFVLHRNPDALHLALALGATTLALWSGTRLWRGAVANVRQSIRELAESMSSLQPGASIASVPPALEQLSVAIEQRLADLAAVHTIELEALDRSYTRLSDTIGELEEANTHLEDRLARVRADRQLEQRSISSIAAATMQPLTSMIGFTNLLAGSENRDHNHIEGLTRAAASLVLLTRELQGFDYSGGGREAFDIRQLTDEVIACVAPVAVPARRILPFYDEYGHKRFEGNTAVIKALLFNYVLMNLLDSDAPVLHLTVTRLGDLLAIGLTPSGMVANMENSRFSDLMAMSGAVLEDGILSLPVTVDDTFRQPDTGVTALVVCDEMEEEASISVRLGSMCVDVVNDNYDVDLCIAALAEESEIFALAAKLPAGATLLSLNNTTPISFPNGRQLHYPLIHEQLALALLELADRRNSNRPTVLLVDDNDANLKLSSLLLEDLGINVETAGDGRTAIALAGRHHFSLVMLDLHLPDMDGYQVATTIRGGNPHIPIVILTAQTSADEESRLLQAGVTRVLGKPMTREKLAALFAGETQSIRVPRRATRSRLLEIFDSALSLKLANNRPELAEELLEELVESLPSELEEIDHAFEAGDFDGLRERVHRLNGGIRYCGVPRLQHAVDRLETITKHGTRHEIGFALKVFDTEARALLAWFDPEKRYFDTSVLGRSRHDL